MSRVSLRASNYSNMIKLGWSLWKRVHDLFANLNDDVSLIWYYFKQHKLDQDNHSAF